MKNFTLFSLIELALEVEQKMNLAIENNENDIVDCLASEFDAYVSAILCSTPENLSDLKHKCRFGEKLIIPEHNEPSIVTDIFSKLIHDIRDLAENYGETLT